jgi:hypothetical protein
MARGPVLKPLRRWRFLPSRQTPNVESLVLRISELVAERQDLRSAGAPQAAIERNRLQIARAQWELAHALIERYMQAEPARTAA